MLEHPKVLLISREGESSTLRMLLNEHVILPCANNLKETYGLLERGGYDALFCDESLTRAPGMKVWPRFGKAIPTCR